MKHQLTIAQGSEVGAGSASKYDWLDSDWRKVSLDFSCDASSLNGSFTCFCI
jgi:hypothetical protein